MLFRAEAVLGLLKLTVPGPLTLDQRIVSVLPIGKPSSVTVPLSVALEGSVTARSGPAFTTGGWLPAASADRGAASTPLSASRRIRKPEPIPLTDAKG